jgi:hypothetical protein
LVDWKAPERIRRTGRYHTFLDYWSGCLNDWLLILYKYFYN